MIWYHELDPFLIRFGENFGIRWYGLAYLAGFFAAYGLLIWQSRRGWLDLSAEKISDFVFTVALVGVLGGRVGYVFLYGFEDFLDDPVTIIKIWEGGMSIHGGIAGGVIGAWLATRKEKVSFRAVTDALALSAPPGLMFGRLANFINGELWGRATDGTWGVIFPASPAGPEGILIPRHPSQLYQAGLEGPLLFAVLYFVRKYSRTPGATGMAFLMAYSVFRFFVEFYRAPDPHLGFLWLGLSRGQIYSVVIFAVGLIGYAVLRRKKKDPAAK